MKNLFFLFLPLLLSAFKSSKLNNRIVGGTLTSIQENPWQISLQAFGNHNCGGSIISPNVIVTAAHCFDGIIPLMYKVVSGTDNLSNNGKVSSIQEYIVHKAYNGFSNDIALIFLEDDLDFDDSTQAILLSSTEPNDGDVVYVTGFGALSESNSTASDLLYGVDVKIVNREKCSSQYKNVEDASIDASMICAAADEGNKDACSSDSGGPLSLGGVLVGIVSWGNDCGNVAYPGVYANVASVREWIKENSGI